MPDARERDLAKKRLATEHRLIWYAVTRIGEERGRLPVAQELRMAFVEMADASDEMSPVLSSVS